jgi:hypothetical protein
MVLALGSAVLAAGLKRREMRACGASLLCANRINRIDTSGKSLAKWHHRDEFVSARAEKSAAGFFVAAVRQPGKLLLIRDRLWLTFPLEMGPPLSARP